MALAPWLAMLVAAPPTEAQGRVAVMDVKITDVREELGPLLTEILTTEVQNTRLFDNVIAGRDVAAMLSFEEQKQVMGCDDVGCLAEIGGALGVDRLVLPQVGMASDTFIVTIKLISIKNAETENRVYRTVKGEEKILLETIPALVKELFGITPQAPPLAATTKVESSGVPILPIVLIASGVAAVGVGVGFGVKAKGHSDNANDPTFAGGQLEISRGRTSSIIANVGYGVGGALVAGGLIAWILEATAAPATATVAVSDGVTVQVGGRF